MWYKYIHEITFSDSSTSAFGSSVVNTQLAWILRSSGFSRQAGSGSLRTEDACEHVPLSPYSLLHWVQRVSSHLKKIAIWASCCRAGVCNFCDCVGSVWSFPLCICLVHSTFWACLSHMLREKVSWMTWCPYYNLTSCKVVRYRFYISQTEILDSETGHM